ncbi:MAG TPA: ParB/RepB/Spo0J family partition protein [Treponemataceae bacterium]|nr:ParB/RepB/Spo0J family partition protein [Treponemataceae bacterium]
MAKKGLGKGLGALLSEAENEVGDSIDIDVASGSLKNTTNIKNKSLQGDSFVNLDLLEPNPQQPRTDFDEASLNELAESIREHGVIQPILVEDNGKGGYYIIAGERRTRAARLAGLDEIPVRIKKFSEQNKLAIALIENIQREDLNAVEEALAYKKLMELGNLSQEAVAKQVGKNRSTVTNCLRLLKLPLNMQTALANGKISAGHARALLSVINPSKQDLLFDKIIADSLSVRGAETEATHLNNISSKQPKQSKKPVDVRDPDLVNIEQQFIEKLGTKVSIQGGFEKGSLKIDYYSKDDLERLYNLIISE